MTTSFVLDEAVDQVLIDAGDERWISADRGSHSRNAVDDESHTVRGRYGRRIRLQSPRGLNGALACSEEDHDLVVDAVDLNANGIERGRKCTYLYTYVHACI